MARFKVGDRVRIRCQASRYNGMTGTIWNIDPGSRNWADCADACDGDTANCVDVDGYGRNHWNGRDLIAFTDYQLAPLTDPGADEFIQNMERFAKERELLEVRGGAV